MKERQNKFFLTVSNVLSIAGTWNILNLTLVVASLQIVSEALVTKNRCLNKIFEGTTY